MQLASSGGKGLSQRPPESPSPEPEVDVGRESTFPYWFWVPFPEGGVTLKNLEGERVGTPGG